MLGISNSLTSIHYPQTNWQTERFDRTIFQIIRCYVAYHQQDTYIHAFKYAYNMDIHRNTVHSPFNMVLIRSTPYFFIQGEAHRTHKNIQYRRKEFVKNTEEMLQKSTVQLKRSKARFKCDFDRHKKLLNKDIKCEDYFYIDPESGGGGMNLGGHSIGPFLVLDRNDRTFFIKWTNYSIVWVVLSYQGHQNQHIVHKKRLWNPPTSLCRPEGPARKNNVIPIMACYEHRRPSCAGYRSGQIPNRLVYTI